TLITVDTKQPMPEDFHLKDLEQSCATLVWKAAEKVSGPVFAAKTGPDTFSAAFQWKDADFGQFPLEVDAPPDDEFCTRLLRIIGDKAKDANRVEVPFDFLAPTRDQWWTSDSRAGLRVPLGRAGATKRQYLQLGQGTAQHVLIAGKTGSGKS